MSRQVINTLFPSDALRGTSRVRLPLLCEVHPSMREPTPASPAAGGKKLETLIQECDFDGRAIADPEALHDLSPLAACFDSGGPQHSLVYTGLEGAGPHLAFLTAKVHFSVSSGHKSESLAGPLEVRIHSYTIIVSTSRM